MVAGRNSQDPEKASEKSNHIVIEHIAVLLASLKEQPEKYADKVHSMIHTANNVAATCVATLGRKLPLHQPITARGS